MNVNKELAELLGLCWHKPVHHYAHTFKCSKCGNLQYATEHNPDFTTEAGKIELLRLMQYREDWDRFLDSLWACEFVKHRVSGVTDTGIPLIFIMDTMGLLAQAALEFLRKEADHD